jgi:hypothetical protein
MKLCLILPICFAMCLPAAGSVDGGPNCISLFFDEGAEVNCLEGVEVGELVHMYVVLTNPTHDIIYGFEFGYDVAGEADVFMFGINDPVVWPGGPFNNFIVGFSYPYPTAESTVLAWQQMIYQDSSSGPVEFFPHGSSPSSLDPNYPVLLVENGELIQCNMLTDGSAMAVINGDCNVVPIEVRSFDSLKSLYRN